MEKPKQSSADLAKGIAVLVVLLVGGWIYFESKKAPEAGPSTPPPGAGITATIPEPTRKHVWEAANRARYQAEYEAEGLHLGKQNDSEGLLKYAAEADRRRAMYEVGVLDQYKITRQQLDAIVDEALAKKWPMPEPTQWKAGGR